jgi:hypothetical protein
MNFSAQLARLILDFYREDPGPYGKILPLVSCDISRRWGTLRISCSDAQTAEHLIQEIDRLREPIAQLRLARRLQIRVKGELAQVFPVNPPAKPWGKVGRQAGHPGLYFPE